MTSISSISSSTTNSYVSKYDTNGDGTVSAAELAAANTTTSTSTSTSLLSSTSDDSTGAGNAAAEQLSSMMMSMILQAGDSDTQGDQSGDDAPGEMSVSDLDTDGDGVVSAAEFAATKPDDVTDEMSAQLFSALDADGNGSVDESELSAMRNGPPPPPPSGGDEASASDEDISVDDLLAQLKELTEQYLASAGGDMDTSALITTV